MSVPFTQWLISVFGVGTIEEAVIRFRSEHYAMTYSWNYEECKRFILYMYNAQSN